LLKLYLQDFFCISLITAVLKQQLETMNSKIILHIPHSSTNIPFKEGYTVDSISLEKEILKK